MDEQTELANLISRWLADSGLNWVIDWGTHDTSRPMIIRRHSWGNPIGHLISGHKVLIDPRYPREGIYDIWLDIRNPKFFEQLKKYLIDCEEIFNY